MADLEEMSQVYRRVHGRPIRVATKYMNLTRRFFAQRGVTGYRIVASLGATEGAPAADLAEIIVDITTTGATLRANGLKVLSDGVILKSEANLIASKLALLVRLRAGGATAAILARLSARDRRGTASSPALVQAIEPLCRVAKERRLFLRGSPRRQPFEGIPVDGIGAGDLVDREVAFEHERAGAEGLDGGLDVGPPGIGQLLRGGWRSRRWKRKAIDAHAKATEFDR